MKARAIYFIFSLNANLFRKVKSILDSIIETSEIFIVTNCINNSSSYFIIYQLNKLYILF